ncbi:MAG: CBS domain-containing protein [Microcoleaceae cyanobacterium MO_207.B10]|nr:CBS domain-containing protein [Microcoleaceae cyanobacterium MO_207.B10]
MVYQSNINSAPLEQAIDRHPLMVSPETPFVDVLRLMCKLQSSYNLPNVNISKNGKNDDSVLSSQAKATIVLVVENKSTLLGIFTTSDLVKLIATDKISNLDNVSESLTIADVMSATVVILKESDEQDLFTALSLFREHKISHLPVVDSKSQIVGVVTPERIRQVLQPSNILRLRRVNEVKNDIPAVTTPKTSSLLKISKLMSEQQLSCLVITEEKKLKTQKTSIEKPVGLITTDDIVQSYFIDLDFAQTPVTKIMKTTLNCLKPTDSLWDAHQKMLKDQVQILVVCGRQGELQGIVHQTSLLQVLDPTVMFSMVRKLRKDVNQLQAEKFELLRTRNAELEKEVRARTAEIQAQLERDRLLAHIALRIHQSLNLDEIINAAVMEVQQFLNADRVVLVRVESSTVARVVAESVASNYDSCLGDVIPVKCLINKCIIQAITNIEESELDAEEIARLQQKQVKAFLKVPILEDGQLWGIMSTHQCSGEREWQSSEIDLLTQLATQLAIAIQQAQLYQQVQTLNTDLERQVQERTAQLEQKVKELEQLNILKDDFLSTVSHELRTPLSNMKMAIYMLSIMPTSERCQQYLHILDTECKREIELITDLLDLQRLEAGGESVCLDSLDLADWLPNILEPFKSRTQERQQKLKVKSPKKLPKIRSNNNSLSRILAELLNNACKYTQDGGEVKFTIEFDRIKDNKKSLDETPSMIKFIISNPSEIPESELPKIFNKFYRVPNADPWKQGGTGLGLALVKKLVEQLQGDLSVVSSNGRTTFTVELPM